MAKGRATIESIAARAGVSVSTVSNVFNGKGRFSDGTRDRVLSAAKELHYVPNALIRSLQKRKTNVVGVRAWPLQVNPTSSITMMLLSGVADGLAEAGYDLLYYLSEAHQYTGGRAVTLLDGRVDGAVIGSGFLPVHEMRALAESGLPTVVMYRSKLPPEFGSVAIDNIQGMADAVRHLVQLGHKRIGFYGPGVTFDLTDRHDGYKAALEAEGIRYDDDLSLTPEIYEASIPEAAAQLLALPNPPTALIAGDDMLALDWIRAFQAKGLRVPQDISVIGFDDVPDAQNAPGLTTVRQPVYEVGRRAAIFAVQLIEGADPAGCRVVLPVELIVRSTTAPPKA